MNVERALAEKHYADLSSKPFFGGLVDYICSGPVVAMVSSCPRVKGIGGTPMGGSVRGGGVSG